MRILADESCDFEVVRALRARGHDVVAIVEVAAGAHDAEVAARAAESGSLLLTEDKDFGQLVFASSVNTAGVLLMRFPARARTSLVNAVLAVVERDGRRLAGRFTVVQPGCVRMSAMRR